MSLGKTATSLHITPRRERGFTLLEALIGFLILSVGMLGIASLQAISLQAGKASVYGSVAVMKVDELFESIRANPTALVAYGVNGAGNGVNNGCSGTNKCTPDQLAQEDIFWWKKDMKAGMPASASTTVTVVAPVAPSKMGTVTIQVDWKERDTDTGSSIDRSYNVSTQICTEVPC